MCEADFKFSFIKIVISDMNSILEQSGWREAAENLF